MDIDLRLPSGEQTKEEEEHNGIDNMLDGEEKLSLHNGEIESGNIVVADEVRAEDGGGVNSPTEEMVMFKEDTNLEPLSGMEFESHGEAYSFYQEYARSMGFNTAIQNSRRSKTSREFIDAKFACSRYGTKREYDKSYNRPRARQSKQDQENATGRRSCAKTDCKASMHVKRRPDGKWVIHSFVKEHNHELLPAQAVSEQTRKMYAAMARQFAEYKNRFQVEVVGAVACHPKQESQNETNIIFRVQDLEKTQDFVRAMKLSEEGSLSQESYGIAFRALEEAVGNCLSVNTSNKNLVEAVTSPTHGLICVEEDNQSRSMNKTNKRKNLTKKRKVQLNLMAPTRDNYYGNQQTIQGLGQLNSIAPSHDGYYSAQQGMHGLGQMDFFRTPTSFTYGIRITVGCRLLFSPEIGGVVEKRVGTDSDDMGGQDNLHGAGGSMSENMINVVDAVYSGDVVVDSSKMAVAGFEGESNFEPRNGIEFESHEAAYSFYQEYAKSMGFTTSIKNSRRSKKSKEFIDAKFACSRYGVTPESDSGSSRRSSVKKTDCKASMHVKRRADGNEEGSLSDENYNIVFRALVDGLKNCVNVNNSSNNVLECSSHVQGLREAEEINQGSLATKSNKKKNTIRKRKVGTGTKVQSEQDILLVEAQESLQQMENLTSDGIALNGFYGSQQNVQGLVQLNLMEPPHDGYYVNQQSLQGLGQLNSIAPGHDGFFGAQQSMHGLGQLDFRPPTSYSYGLQVGIKDTDESHLRQTQLHEGMNNV
ncbi:hypothetical protein CUMW_002720 [Citrus unshiu]|nr:hypothetical protein CUMW_002720 [Citrus unshiu]